MLLLLLLLLNGNPLLVLPLLIDVFIVDRPFPVGPREISSFIFEWLVINNPPFEELVLLLLLLPVPFPFVTVWATDDGCGGCDFFVIVREMLPPLAFDSVSNLLIAFATALLLFDGFDVTTVVAVVIVDISSFSVAIFD